MTAAAIGSANGGFKAWPAEPIQTDVPAWAPIGIEGEKDRRSAPRRARKRHPFARAWPPPLRSTSVTSRNSLAMHQLRWPADISGGAIASVWIWPRLQGC